MITFVDILYDKKQIQTESVEQVCQQINMTKHPIAVYSCLKRFCSCPEKMLDKNVSSLTKLEDIQREYDKTLPRNPQFPEYI